jgi:hypothetical protein
MNYYSLHTHHKFDPNEFELYDVGEEAYQDNRTKVDPDFETPV